MSFPPPGNRDFTERDMVKVAAMHAESQAEIVTLRAERDSLRADFLVYLAEWNALVSAIGSRTHGGAVGHGAALLAERDALRAENKRLEDLNEQVTNELNNADNRVAELVGRIGELNAELHERDKTLVDLRLQVARKGDRVKELEAERDKLRAFAYHHIDPFELSEEDQAFFDTIRATQEGE